jgi:hypothetical protein
MKFNEIIKESKIQETRTPTDKQLIYRIDKNAWIAIQTIQNLFAQNIHVSKNVLLHLVQRHGGFLSYPGVLERADNDIIMAALKNHGQAIKDIKNPTPEMQVAAVTQDIGSIAFIHGEISEKALEIAVQENGTYIKYSEHPSEHLQILAAQNTYNALSYVKNPTPAAQLSAIERFGFPAFKALFDYYDRQGNHQYRNLDDRSIFVAMLQKNPIEVLENFNVELTKEEQLIAFEKNPSTYRFMKNKPWLDPEITKKYEAYQFAIKNKLRKDNRLPLAGKGSITTGLNQDQLRLIRWMDTNNRDSISVKELKSMPWGNSPSLASLVKKTGGRDITRADVMIFRDMVPTTALKLVSEAKIDVQEWKGSQVMFKNHKNIVAIYSSTGKELDQALDLDDNAKSILSALRQGIGHPIPKTAPSNNDGLLFQPSYREFKDDTRYTIGWVRFTQFGKDIWIDEVQTDLLGFYGTGTDRKSVLKNEIASKIKDLTDEILLDFLRRMRRRGVEKFFMPTHDMKKTGYEANPPQSIYKELPRKMRFKIGTVEDVDPLVNGQEAWILESLKTNKIKI